MSTMRQEMEDSNNSSTCPLVCLLCKSIRIILTSLQVPLTVPAAQGGGVFGGYWVTMHVQQVAENISWIKWGVYRCVSGNPFGKYSPPDADSRSADGLE